MEGNVIQNVSQVHTLTLKLIKINYSYMLKLYSRYYQHYSLFLVPPQNKSLVEGIKEGSQTPPPPPLATCPLTERAGIRPPHPASATSRHLPVCHLATAKISSVCHLATCNISVCHLALANIFRLESL